MKKTILALALIVCSAGLRAQHQPDTVNIENGAVRAYLADSTYWRDTCYLTSVVMQYNVDSLSKHRDWPAGKTARWKHMQTEAGVAQVCITVSEQPDYSDSVTHFTSPDNRSYIIRNMLPNRTYYYKVTETDSVGVSAIVKRGSFVTTGTRRMIRVAGCHNVRDMGGWPTSFGMPIRYGLLYRGAKLDKITEEGVHDLRDNLCVEAELDLRGDQKPITCSPLGEDIAYTSINNSSYLYSISKRWEPFVEDLRWIVQQMQEDKVVYYHCMIGCDRCGALSFLLGGLMGMSEEDLCRDFELSSLAGHDRQRSFKERRFANMIPYIRSFGEPDDNLQQCFYKYWIARGMTAEELDFFIQRMVGERRASAGE